MALPVGFRCRRLLRRQSHGGGLALFPWKPPLHWAMARLGLVLGEFFDLKALAEDSAARGRYTGFIAAALLHLRGGIGNPGNTLAFR